MFRERLQPKALFKSKKKKNLRPPLSHCQQHGFHRFGSKMPSIPTAVGCSSNRQPHSRTLRVMRNGIRCRSPWLDVPTFVLIFEHTMDMAITVGALTTSNDCFFRHRFGFAAILGGEAVAQGTIYHSVVQDLFSCAITCTGMYIASLEVAARCNNLEVCASVPSHCPGNALVVCVCAKVCVLWSAAGDVRNEAMSPNDHGRMVRLNSPSVCVPHIPNRPPRGISRSIGPMRH